ncbi:cytochrome P450 [Nonomuraea rhizosphaerae]|uniref:cytochrome P450 n=1 Tax=Nonomuraea rhizosphaerae TaxID=2665663 RepID=UPI001C5D35D1|nr:cytochrome P450 [Nonomuraea rhizosphaerae]
MKQIPTAPRALPVAGHLLSLLRDPYGFIAALPRHGELVQVRLGPFTVIVVCDAGLTYEVLRDDRTFDKGGPLFDRLREVTGNGLASCPRSDHRRQRRLAQPAFQASRLPGYAEAMTACILQVTSSWRDGQVLDVPAEMGTITSRAVTATMFSDALTFQALDSLLDDVRTVTEGIVQRMVMFPPLDRLPTSANRAYWRARSRLRHTLGQVIATRRANGGGYEDLLAALLAARDEETGGHGLTDTEITDAFVTFFLAGTDTTGTALAWALHLIAGHPAIEQRLHAEVDAVLAGRPATHADLPRLELTGRVITETLRLYPPGWLITRTVTAGTRLGRHDLPAGATVAYSPYLIHRRDDLYDAPESFDPDRWGPGRPQPPRQACLPFGGGARKCIGDTFAMAEATLALATIVGCWRLQSLDQRPVRPALSLVAHPHRLRMRTVSRDRTAPAAS